MLACVMCFWLNAHTVAQCVRRSYACAGMLVSRTTGRGYGFSPCCFLSRPAEHPPLILQERAPNVNGKHPADERANEPIVRGILA